MGTPTVSLECPSFLICGWPSYLAFLQQQPFLAALAGAFLAAGFLVAAFLVAMEHSSIFEKVVSIVPCDAYGIHVGQ